jgi:hypothetical protein
VLLISLHPWLRNGAGTAGDASASAPSDSSAEPPDPTADDGSGPPGTPRPTRTPSRRSSSDNGDENDDDNGNDNATDPTPTRVPTDTRAPTPTRTPTDTRAPTETRTPTPTRTPRPPDPTDTPEPTDTPRPTPTDTPEPTATLAPAAIDGLDPTTPSCGQSLTIRGQRFGSSRGAVDGKVYVDGAPATVESWEMARIVVQVPRTVHPGNSRRLEIFVAGHSVKKDDLRVSC